jgi:starch synthase
MIGISQGLAMHIIMASSEMSPFAKTGGLGDVLGSLPYALSRKGHEVTVFLPLYKFIGDLSKKIILNSSIRLGTQDYSFSTHEILNERGVAIYGISNKDFFDRSGIYGKNNQSAYEDNDKRFLLFNKAIVETILRMELSGILHSHDWPTALLPLFIKEAKVPNIKTVFTIHNLTYQGIFDFSTYSLTNLPPKYFSIEGLEYYGKMNWMKGGIIFADLVTTVSRQYAKEIQTVHSGCGLEGVLQAYQSKLVGIVNGIDYQQWDPNTDNSIKAKFNSQQLNGKSDCKKSLAEEFRLKFSKDKPIFGIVTRFVPQKGLDLLLKIVHETRHMGIQFTVLGSGEKFYEHAFQKIAAAYPQDWGVKIGFDEGLAHRIFAGCDFFLMPSLHEPCGLAQLYAMRYGSIPIVHAVGGLEDTVQAWDSKSAKGWGLKFNEPSAQVFLRTIEDALEIYRDKSTLTTIRKNAMNVDCSWEKSGAEYATLYRKLLEYA